MQNQIKLCCLEKMQQHNATSLFWHNWWSQIEIKIAIYLKLKKMAVHL